MAWKCCGCNLLRLALVLLLRTAEGWLQDGEPIFHPALVPKSFRGGGTGTNFFRLLEKNDNTIVIGGRNIMYNLSVKDLEIVKKPLEWNSSQAHRELCMLKGKSAEVDCQNYIRISAHTGENKWLICGTNSYKPVCRYYDEVISKGHLKLENITEFEGPGYCPFNPEHNSTSIHAHGRFYSATVADFSATDALIYSPPVRTEYSDFSHLNNPSFVSSISHQDYVYFFFRETAVEYMNCGKAIYSRVARVCSKDKGSRQFHDKWTSFLKARLNCSIQGEYPFYFDEIQSTSQIISGIYGNSDVQNEIIYGVFTTPVNAIGGSAVCAFAVRDILAVFEGDFKGQESINSNWLPVKSNLIPKKRPGKCVNNSHTVPDETINFIRNHPLMEQAVPTFLSKPLIVKVSFEFRFTAIAVFPQVSAVDGKVYDIIYIGTDKGKVIKTLNAVSGDSNFDDTVNEESRAPVETVVVSEQQVLEFGTPIIQMHISVSHKKLIVVGNDIVSSVSLNHCSNMTSCDSCVKLRDPHCAWHTSHGTCSWVETAGQVNQETHLQDVKFGNSYVCNKLSESYNNEDQIYNTHGTLDGSADYPELEKGNDISNDISIQIPEISQYESSAKPKHTTGPFKRNNEENMEYTASALHFAIAASCSVTLLIGFVVGYLFSRRFRHPFFSETNPFHEQHNHLNRLPPLETPLNVNSTTYLPRRENKTINLVVNVPMKQDNLQHELGNKDRTHECKNSNESLDKDIKCGTLQKVKKTYI